MIPSLNLIGNTFLELDDKISQNIYNFLTFIGCSLLKHRKSRMMPSTTQAKEFCPTNQNR